VGAGREAPATAQTIELTLWAANVIGRPLSERVEVARAGGFANTTLFPIEIRRARQAGRAEPELRALFEDAGVRIAVVDPIAHWLPGSHPPANLPADDPAAGGFRPREVYELATSMGAGLVTMIAVFDDRVDIDTAAQAFADCCDEAADYGLRLQLEFIPATGVGDLASAWEIVRRADRPGGGLILDAWHFFRSGADFELLAKIPAERVFAVQLDDAPARPAADVAFDSLHGRLLPGDGELELTRFLSTLLSSGIPSSVGPEVFSDALRELAPAELGRRLGESTRSLLDACWPVAWSA
jgi:sugar phosphate isomerase/epimerase